MILDILTVLGILSMVIGVLLAIGQWDFKRLLAYHSISQVGYIILGISLGTPLGILGGILHLINHSIFKSLLFLNSGAVEYATGTRDLHKLGGLRNKMPVTAATNLVALATPLTSNAVLGLSVPMPTLPSVSSFIEVESTRFSPSYLGILLTTEHSTPIIGRFVKPDPSPEKRSH